MLCSSYLKQGRFHRRRNALVAWALFIGCPSITFAQKKPVTVGALEEIAKLMPQGPGNPLAWSPDGTQFVYRQTKHLWIYDIATRTARDLLDASVLDEPRDGAATDDALGVREPFLWQNRRVSETPVQWTADGRQLLYSSGGDLYLIQVADGKWAPLVKTSEAERDPKLSPDGKQVAFRRGWDLYTVDLTTHKERRLTEGGSETLRNGGLDWVYPEELDLGTAYWWSPDSKSIAYLQVDTSHEPVYPHEDLRGRALYEPQRYPQAGNHNPDVKLGVISAKGGSTRWLEVGDTRDEYLIARVTWTPDSKSIYVVRPNRVQSRLELLAFDARSGKSKKILEESSIDWVNVEDEPKFVNNGTEFLWLSERDGFRHIYLYSASGELVKQLTRGPWEVTAIAGVNEAAGQVYYASSETSPLERQIYVIGLKGDGKRQLSTGAGTHSIALGPGAKYYLHGYSSTSAPPSITLHSADGTELAVHRAADRRVVDQYEILPTELLNYQGPDGTTFYARLIRPAGFDRTKKYPAVVLVYGGPGAQGVRNNWFGADLDQVLARAGFVVWQVDNRGSAGRGHAFESPVFRNLGPVELADQVAGVKQLVSMGFVDPARVGIRGWSYGGFMTLNAMLNAPVTFRAGAAGAPVTDWKNYDTIYTERYMGLPSVNVDGYKNTAMPQNAKNLKGPLMILHNLEDDNVLFQNTVQMMEALEREGKQFELTLYTQKTHGVTGGDVNHMNAALLGFFERHLK
ncbi:MAG: DPP IV N-terminal domain-containing protein [Acidobacteriota bacterium]